MTKRDLERIALATRHFDRMRAGLAVAGIGPILLFLLAAKGSPPWIYLAVLPVSLLILWTAERWTTRRFGRVVRAEHSGGSRRWLPLLGAVTSFQVWKFDNSSLGSGQPALTLILIGAAMLWFSIREWPFRSYRLVMCGLAFAGAAAHMGVVTEADLLQWRVVWCGSVVLAGMAVGVLDYWTLVRVFGAARRPERVDNADAV